MKRYIKSSNDLWYTDKNGNQSHAFIDLRDSDSVYRVLDDIVGSEFAEEFRRQLDDLLYDDDAIMNVVKADFDELETILGDTGSDVTDLRMILNDLAEKLGDEDDEINELVSRSMGQLDEIEEDLSTANGYIYDSKDDLGLLD